MTDEDELVAFDDPQPDLTSTADSLDGIKDDFLDELMRTQSQKKLDLVSDIEERARVLEQALGDKISSFLQLEIRAEFADLFMFHRLAIAEQGLTSPQIALMDVGEDPVAGIAIQRDSVRRLLSIALTGNDLTSDAGDKMSAAETSLFLVFADYLATVLYEMFPGIREMGIPEKSRRVTRDAVIEIADETDWICFTFRLPVEGNSETLLIMTPMAMLESTQQSHDSYNDYDQDHVEIDPAWRSALFDRIENLPMPMTVELAGAEMPLSVVDSFSPGQTLEIPIVTNSLNVVADPDTLLLRAALELKDGNLNLRVIEAAG